MTTKEVADQLIGFCRDGRFREAIEALYSPEIVSMEAGAPPGGSRVTRGIEAIRAKNESWNASHEAHSTVVEGPLVAGSHFVVTFKMDMTVKTDSRRFIMEELAVYEVADGKIVYEEFFYRM
jgi:ketosteroid isomerase-like protein